MNYKYIEFLPKTQIVTMENWFINLTVQFSGILYCISFVFLHCILPWFCFFISIDGTKQQIYYADQMLYSRLLHCHTCRLYISYAIFHHITRIINMATLDSKIPKEVCPKSGPSIKVISTCQSSQQASDRCDCGWDRLGRSFCFSDSWQSWATM